MSTTIKINVDDQLANKLLTGNEFLPAQKFTNLTDEEDRLETIEKGLMLLTKLTTDWSIQTTEWKKLLEIIIVGIPDKINGETIKSKELLEKAKIYLSVRSRAKSWSLIQIAVHILLAELPVNRYIGITLIKSIYKTLKPKEHKETRKNGMNWRTESTKRPKKHTFQQAKCLGKRKQN